MWYDESNPGCSIVWRAVVRRYSLWEELVQAVLAMSLLIAVVTTLYWLIMGEPPWAFAIGEAVGFCLGVIILTITSPARR